MGKYTRDIQIKDQNGSCRTTCVDLFPQISFSPAHVGQLKMCSWLDAHLMNAVFRAHGRELRFCRTVEVRWEPTCDRARRIQILRRADDCAHIPTNSVCTDEPLLLEKFRSAAMVPWPQFWFLIRGRCSWIGNIFISVAKGFEFSWKDTVCYMKALDCIC